VKNISAFTRRFSKAPGRGDPPAERPRICADPRELYQPAARQLIGTVLAPWLGRQKATPFELLHRPDLVRLLERAGVDLQHAIQKVAVPAALAREASVHEVVRDLHRIIEQATARLLGEQQAGRLPTVPPGAFAELSNELAADPEGEFRLGAAVAAALATAETWTAKLETLLDLLDAAPADGPGRAIALAALESPIEEMLRIPAAVAELIGAERELGDTVLGLASIAHPVAVGLVLQMRPAFAAHAPGLSATAQRLAAAFASGRFEETRQALSDQALEAFKLRRRLSPDDAAAELLLLRLIAACLTAAGGRFLPAEDVRAAVVERSNLLVEPSFVTDLMAGCEGPLAEMAAVTAILESVAGDANRRRALRWVDNTLATRKLEDQWDEDPERKLGELARLYRRIERGGAGVTGQELTLEAVGALGGRIEAAHKVVQSRVDGMAAREKKIEWLERMATAEIAPPGPAVEEAAAALRRFP
jgi:hypothetical protein